MSTELSLPPVLVPASRSVDRGDQRRPAQTALHHTDWRLLLPGYLARVAGHQFPILTALCAGGKSRRRIHRVYIGRDSNSNMVTAGTYRVLIEHGAPPVMVSSILNKQPIRKLGHRTLALSELAALEPPQPDFRIDSKAVPHRHFERSGRVTQVRLRFLASFGMTRGEFCDLFKVSLPITTACPG